MSDCSHYDRLRWQRQRQRFDIIEPHYNSTRSHHDYSTRDYEDGLMEADALAEEDRVTGHPGHHADDYGDSDGDNEDYDEGWEDGYNF